MAIGGMSVGHLARLRERQETLRLTQVATVQRPANSQSPLGGTKRTFATVLSNIPCRAREAKKPREPVVANQKQPQADWEVVLPVVTAVKTTDRIIVDDDQTYEVLGTDAGRGDALVLIASCVKVGG